MARYVPPHLRNKAPAAPPSAPSNSNGSGAREPPPHLSRPNGGGGRGPPPPRRGVTLCVFGDSFGGPFKLLSDSCVKVQTFKGASAKGLNNPKSLKQVSKELVPLLNTFLAPPPYAYLPPSGRSALLMFGNVDLQVNYLWQLQHKPLGAGTWSERERNQYNLKEDGTVVEEEEDDDHQQIMASATENSGKGPALGPDLFVDNIVCSYCAWLEREVVNGPIGRRAAVAAQEAEEGSTRRLAPTKVLIAAALPPLIEDETLPRIPEKYVERLEDDHVQAHRALERGEKHVSRATWRSSDVEKDMANLALGTKEKEAVESPGSKGKETVESLLKHQPPLCTKPVRVAMTQRYNEAMAAFCAKHPTILAFVDIWPVMLSLDEAQRAQETEAGRSPEIPSTPREVDRVTWACPVDVSNIHPLWEPTLPLWLKALADFGVPTDTFTFSADAEATFKAYEEDKRRRTDTRDFRIKLRDE